MKRFFSYENDSHRSETTTTVKKKLATNLLWGDCELLKSDRQKPSQMTVYYLFTHVPVLTLDHMKSQQGRPDFSLFFINPAASFLILQSKCPALQQFEHRKEAASAAKARRKLRECR